MTKSKKYILLAVIVAGTLVAGVSLINYQRAGNITKAKQTAYNQLKSGQSPNDVFLNLRKQIAENKSISFSFSKSKSEAFDKAQVCKDLAGVINEGSLENDLLREAIKRFAGLSCDSNLIEGFCDGQEEAMKNAAEDGDWQSWDYYFSDWVLAKCDKVGGEGDELSY